MKIRVSLFAAVVALPLLSARSSSAQSVTQNTRAVGPAEMFGGARQWAFSSDAALTIQRRAISGTEGGTTAIQLSPSADYFVIDNLSIGGFIGFDYVHTGDDDSTRFSIGPRVGYNLALSDLVSIWPKGGFSYAYTSTSSDSGTGSTSSSNSAFALNLFAPVVFHPVPHFFAGFGPFLDTDLSGDNRATTFGGKLTLGGWL